MGSGAHVGCCAAEASRGRKLPTEISSKHLVASNTGHRLPYKGTTSRYWSIRIGGTVHLDLAWASDFPNPSAPAHRWPDRLLQRKGRPVPRRPAAPPAQDTPCRISQRAGHQVSATADSVGTELPGGSGALAFQAGGQARADGKLSAERLLASRCRPLAAQIDRICDRRARPCGAQARAPTGGSARVYP